MKSTLNIGDKFKMIIVLLILFLSGCGVDNSAQNSREQITDKSSPDSLTKVSYRNENKSETHNHNTLDNNLDRAYYKNAQGKTGKDLKSSLHQIISNQTRITYGEVWEALSQTDQDPNNKNNVILFYTGRSQSKSEHGDRPNDWNREHVWSQSHFNYNKAIKSDLHNLKPEDVSVNADRGHLDFDWDDIHRENANVDCPENRKHDEAPDTCFDKDSWEPRDEIKGDLARILFYMVVRYEGDNNVDLELEDKVANSSPYHGKLSTLLRWHEQDPVDDFERRRNNIIYQKYQHNRNPFIDHPEWVKQIWE